ncbi:uncharacterized protein LOC129614385 [Condylostylus longicornis]|uniref:uncharacterized protein LOC129614385 n=1 Tax=Condylostylus longicornis TaxID=2530218 RepID=UPI00244DA4D5|nr:uncharacterized protein LOC129614385 [Condylostylus longicornis]
MVSYNVYSCLIVFGFILLSITNVEGHGRLIDPIARGSRWRYNESAPPDYNDNEGFCGGFGIQWGVHGGKCGLCGNSYGDAVPRAHEYGGTYGEGVIVNTYKTSEIDFSVLLTANHRGFFVFDLCNMDNAKESDECFAKNLLELKSGGTKYQLPNYNPNTYYNSTLKIPAGLKCKHCVFRWTYTTANTWGTCEDGSQGLGCGPQETFRGCSDVEII